MEWSGCMSLLQGYLENSPLIVLGSGASMPYELPSMGGLAEEIKKYLNHARIIKEKNEILQNKNEEIIKFLKQYEDVEICINECRNKKQQTEEKMRQYKELDRQENRKEQLKEDCERAKKEAECEQKNYP